MSALILYQSGSREMIRLCMRRENGRDLYLGLAKDVVSGLDKMWEGKKGREVTSSMS